MKMLGIVVVAALFICFSGRAVGAVEPDPSLSCKDVYEHESQKVSLASLALALPPNDKRRNQSYLKILHIPSYDVFKVYATCDHSTIFLYNLDVIQSGVLALTLPSDPSTKDVFGDELDADYILSYGLAIEADVREGGSITPDEFRYYLSVSRDSLFRFHVPIRCDKEYAMLQRWLPNQDLPDLRPTPGACPATDN